MVTRTLLLCGAAAAFISAGTARAQDTGQTGTPTAPASSGLANAAIAPANGAQSAATGETNADIIVTATRTETTLQKTPVAVTVLSGKALEDRGVRSLLDVAAYTPNLTVGTIGGRGGSRGNFNIRGIGSDAPDSSPSVGIYVDEVYYPSVSGNLLGIFDVGRVEVLRGPQGTLFGRNTIAGAVQYISVKPDPTAGFTGFVEGEGRVFSDGSHQGSYRVAGAINIPIGDTLALRVGGQYRRSGGYVHDQLTGTERGADTTYQGRVQLRWTPSPDLTVDLKGEAFKIDGNGRAVTVNAADTDRGGLYQVVFGPNAPPPNIALSPSGSYTNAGFNQPDFYNHSFRIVNGVVRYNLAENIQLKLISGYSFTRTHTLLDFDGTPLSIVAPDLGIAKTYLFTQEGSIHGDFLDNRLHATVGGYYYNQVVRTTSQVSNIGPFPPTLLADTREKTVAKAGYGQATFDIAAGLSATAGLRYSTESLRDSYTMGFDANPLPKPSSLKFNNTSPYFGLNWQVTPDYLVYAKASRGFRAGGAHLSSAYPTGSVQFGPETAWTYEAGARLSFLDNRLRFNPTVFRTDWKNIQFVNVQNTVAGPQAGTQNAGDARLQGVELETQFAVTPQFELHGSFSYLDAHYTQLAPTQPNSFPVIVDLNSTLPRSPKYKYSVGGSYTQPFADGGNVAFSTNFSFTDTQQSSTDGDQTVTMPKYGLLDARIAFTTADKKYTFSIFGTNLTDKYYLTGGINLISVTGFSFSELGRPREIGASARVNF